MKTFFINILSDRSISAKRKIARYRWLLAVIIAGLSSNLSFGQCFSHYYDQYAISVTVGSGATAIAVGDLNGDGRKDMVVVHESDNIVSVVLAKAGGGFGVSNNIPVFNAPTAVAIGDFNGDKKPDIIVTFIGSKDVKVYLNNKFGGFSQNVYLSTPAGPYPSAIAVGDFNGDGNQDVVVTEETTAKIRVMLGTGLGDFLPPNTYVVGSGPRSVAIGDLTGDGKPEIVVGNYVSGSISVLYNKGLLGFNPAFNYVFGNNIQKVILADFNGDNKLDVAMTNFMQSSITTMLNNGVGTFSTTNNYTVGNGPSAIVAGDVNGDGKTDLVVADYFSHDTALLLNNGSGVFNAPTKYSSGVNTAPRDVALLDANGDGKLDIAVLKPNNNTAVMIMTQHTCPIVNTLPYKVKDIPNQVATIGKQFSYTVEPGTYSDAETPNQLIYKFSNLPAGLTFTPPATISGIPTGPAGVFYVNYLVTDPTGSGSGSAIYFTILKAPAIKPKQPNTTTNTANGRFGAEESETAVTFGAISYPNPVDDQFTVEIEGAADNEVRLLLTDINGRTIIDRLVQVEDNHHQEILEIAQKRAGLYFLKVGTSTNSQTLKVLKR